MELTLGFPTFHNNFTQSKHHLIQLSCWFWVFIFVVKGIQFTQHIDYWLVMILSYEGNLLSNLSAKFPEKQIWSSFSISSYSSKHIVEHLYILLFDNKSHCSRIVMILKIWIHSFSWIILENGWILIESIFLFHWNLGFRSIISFNQTQCYIAYLRICNIYFRVLSLWLRVDDC